MDDLRSEGYEAFYIAIGAQGSRKLNIPGEDNDMVESGIDFLRKVNKTEDPNLISGDVVVVGGGNVAIDVARAALRSGAEKVHLYSLEQEAEMPASFEEVSEAKEDGIILHCGWGPKEILEDSIVFKQCVSVKDETARFNPSYDENVLETIQCSHVLLSIGQSIVPIQGFDIEVNPNGTIKADGTTLQTSVEDVFAGGDVYTGPKFAIDAISHGKEAAESMHRFVHKGHSLTIGRDLHLFNEFDKNNALIDIDFDHAKRQIPGIKKGLGEKSFRDLRSTFTEEQVKIEANRCLGCGASIVDTNKCIGCGLCTTECEFDAIHLTRDIKDGAKMVKAEDKMKAILPYAAKRQIKIIRNKKK